jgi:hypothetical protein
MPLGQIAYQVDKNARILTIKVVGEVSDARALRDIPRIWERDPAIVGYDSVIDLRLDEGTISWESISQIAEKWQRFAGSAAATRRTAVVVRSDLWDPIVAMIAERFPNRPFKTFRTLEDARLWLARST